MEHQKIVLVVEDDIALQEALKLKLGKENGIHVVTASTGEEALAILQKETPDLVTLDILLPGMNGLSVLHAMREDPRLKNVRVIIVSVSGDSKKMKEAFGLNVIAYLIKSEYKIDDLVKKIKELLSLP